jgi:dihydrodipicolinate synthase/N-acetylneuraminate lyase
MSEPFHGVLPALITPFTGDGSAIDTGALAANVDRLIDGGVGGLVPGGSTGEFTTLTNAERRQLIEATVQAAATASPSSRAPARSRRARPSSSACTPSKPAPRR